jgi:large subunit ribosomal protein L21
MKYAVIRTGGKQYKVAEGQVIEVEKLLAEPNSSITFSDVLLVAGENTPVIGSPLITDVAVTGKVLEQIKGEKIRVAKYKAKVRYRRVTGHRQLLTRVQIESIGSGKKDTPKEETVKPVRKTAVKKS